jgi:cytochrome c556
MATSKKTLAKDTKKYTGQQVQFRATKEVAKQTGVADKSWRDARDFTPEQKKAASDFNKADMNLGKGVGNRINPKSKGQETKTTKRVNQSIVARGGKPVKTYTKKAK